MSEFPNSQSQQNPHLKTKIKKSFHQCPPTVTYVLTRKPKFAAAEVSDPKLLHHRYHGEYITCIEIMPVPAWTA
jgi:hypothetical protein